MARDEVDPQSPAPIIATFFEATIVKKMEDRIGRGEGAPNEGIGNRPKRKASAPNSASTLNESSISSETLSLRTIMGSPRFHIHSTKRACGPDTPSIREVINFYVPAAAEIVLSNALCSALL